MARRAAFKTTAESRKAAREFLDKKLGFKRNYALEDDADEDEFENDFAPPKLKSRTELDRETAKEVSALKRSNSALKAANTKLSKSNLAYRKDNIRLTVELDSACAAFSEALVQADTARKEVKKKYPQLKEVYELAESAVKMAAYIRGTAKENEPTPVIVLKMEQQVQKLIGK